MKLQVPLRCFTHSLELSTSDGGDVENSSALVCPDGCRFPVVEGVPRFVESDAYAASFGLQWKTFRKTQLDSHTGTNVSRGRLTRCLGRSLNSVNNKDVLECGCGAGRFTELLLSAGARVCACDLSAAVEANFANCGDSDNYMVFQADLRNLPVQPRSFDVVVCLGVVVATPNPKAAIAALAEYVKPGGLLVIDNYNRNPNETVFHKIIRPFLPWWGIRQVLKRLPPGPALKCTNVLARSLLPIHRLLWRDGPIVDRVRRLWVKISPVFDYYDRHTVLRELSNEQLTEWAILNTHDGLTDYYQILISPDDMREYLEAAGLTNIEAYYGGIGVEGRAMRPDDNDPIAPEAVMERKGP